MVQRVLWLAGVFVWLSACGDFRPPAPGNDRESRDLAVDTSAGAPDLACFNTACGGCSTWARYDGTPVQAGDACSWKGSWACSGNALACADTSCPSCSLGTLRGTLCGADGHTIIEVKGGTTCAVFSSGSAVAVCNQGAGDECRVACRQNGSFVDCSARCASSLDGGSYGCAYSASATCSTLVGC